jgi:hypothetical protein
LHTVLHSLHVLLPMVKYDMCKYYSQLKMMTHVSSILSHSQDLGMQTGRKLSKNLYYVLSRTEEWRYSITRLVGLFILYVPSI